MGTWRLAPRWLHWLLPVLSQLLSAPTASTECGLRVLQDGVPTAIDTLLDAGIKVWMITGDKQVRAALR